MEAFVCENAGENIVVSALAFLREDLELKESQASRYGEIAAAGKDLIFDFVVTRAGEDPVSMDSWLHGQALERYLSSGRTKTAVWDMSRLPSGPHLSSSASFRWLQRSVSTMHTR
jgi:hypothetical protein